MVSKDTTEQTASSSIFRRSKRTMFIRIASRRYVKIARHHVLLYTKHDTTEAQLYVYEICILSWSAIFFQIKTSLLHKLPATLFLLRSWQPFKWPDVSDYKAVYSSLHLHPDAMVTELPCYLRVTCWDRRNNRATTVLCEISVEAEERNDHCNWTQQRAALWR
jgi:hypothetical protein